MTDIVPFAGSSMLIANDEFAMLVEATSDLGGGGGDFLRHDGNTGAYTYGAAKTELVEGTEVAADFGSVERGYICWMDEKVVEEKMKSFRDSRPLTIRDLTDHGPYEEGDGWSEQASIKFKLLDGTATEVLFKVGKGTKLNAFGSLMKDFANQYKANPGLVPIVQLTNNSFVPKDKKARGATKYAPVMRIVGWEDPANLVAAEEGAAGDYEDNPALEGPEEELVDAPIVEEAPAAPARRTAAPATRAAAPAPAPAARAAAPARGAAAPSGRGRF